MSAQYDCHAWPGELMGRPAKKSWWICLSKAQSAAKPVQPGPQSSALNSVAAPRYWIHLSTSSLTSSQNGSGAYSPLLIGIWDVTGMKGPACSIGGDCTAAGATTSPGTLSSWCARLPHVSSSTFVKHEATWLAGQAHWLP